MPDPPVKPVSSQGNGNLDPRSSVSASASGLGSITLSGGQSTKSDRQQFAADELAIVLSHYKLGVIDKIKEFPRGSRKAPKLLIISERGPFLLKRRAMGKDSPEKVAFCHGIQLHLASKQFPLPSNFLLQVASSCPSSHRFAQRDPIESLLQLVCAHRNEQASPLSRRLGPRTASAGRNAHLQSAATTVRRHAPR